MSENKNIIIYGGELPAFCAAFKLLGGLNDTKANNIQIYIITPYPSSKIGGIATIGGLNYWDAFSSKLDDCSIGESEFKAKLQGNEYETHTYPYYGSFDHLWKTRGFVYGNRKDKSIVKNPEGVYEVEDTNDLASYLDCRIANEPRITVIPMMDIVDLDFEIKENNTKTIKSIYLKSIYRAEDGNVKWGRKTTKIDGDYFVDASTDGKLTAALTQTTTGRYDWPNQHLENAETSSANTSFIGKQQAATLFFKVNNVKTIENTKWKVDTKETGRDYRVINSLNSNKIGLCYYKTDYNTPNSFESEGATKNYNYNEAPSDIVIKRYNINQNGYDSDEWWNNTMLIFDVDGTAHNRDKITKFFPKQMLSTSKTTDDAWIYARNIINTEEFLEGLRGFHFLKNANIIRDNGLPVVGEVLYIRETRHMVLPEKNLFASSKPIEGIENTHYALSQIASLGAGKNSISGNDTENFPNRIGLGYYGADLHPYSKSDFCGSSDYIRYSYNHMRSDLFEGNDNDYNIDYPVYLPVSAIRTSDVNNLVVPGYAASICSVSWGEIRVMSNLCVLGDAAGVILAECINDENNNLNQNVNNVTIDSNFRRKYRYGGNNNTQIRFNKIRINTDETETDY